jgi:hypothetical protein
LRDLVHMIKGRSGRLLGICLLLAGGAGAPVLLAPAADAAVCGPAAPAATCTMPGTLTLTAGSLGVAAPASLTWSSALTGLNLSLVDATDTTYTVDDATGSGAGWNLGVTATTFTAGALVLPNTGTLSTTGSITSATATTAPSAACTTGGGGCVLPVSTTAPVTYPVPVTTATTSPPTAIIYTANANTGMGSILIGSTVPVGWWVAVPAGTKIGTYTSTITLTLASTP